MVVRGIVFCLVLVRECLLAGISLSYSTLDYTSYQINICSLVGKLSWIRSLNLLWISSSLLHYNKYSYFGKKTRCFTLGTIMRLSLMLDKSKKANKFSAAKQRVTLFTTKQDIKGYQKQNNKIQSIFETAQFSQLSQYISASCPRSRYRRWCNSCTESWVLTSRNNLALLWN